MSTGPYIFRVENFTLDQQASTINDFLVLSIFIKVDDSPTQHCFTIPIAQQITSGTRIDLGRWAETNPIAVTEFSIISVAYLVVNLTGGYSDGPFDGVFNELNQNIEPLVQTIASLVQFDTPGYVKVGEAVIDYIYGSNPVPDCSGTVHWHVDQYEAQLLAAVTTGYSVHRIANYPSEPLTAPGGGCNTPASRLSLAVERVPALIAAAGPSKSSDLSIIVTRTVPMGATTAYAFNPAEPTKFVEAEHTLHEQVVGAVSCVAPAGGAGKRGLTGSSLRPRTIGQHTSARVAGSHWMAQLASNLRIAVPEPDCNAVANIRSRYLRR
jgi:hypothetical protein